MSAIQQYCCYPQPCALDVCQFFFNTYFKNVNIASQSEHKYFKRIAIFGYRFEYFAEIKQEEVIFDYFVNAFYLDLAH